MSTGSSGLASKTEKSSKPKFSALNINNLYKGKSLETPRTTVTAKHGLQTLGKVGAGRRIPPPANISNLNESTNISSNTVTSNSSVNLVPSGGSGWVKDKKEDSNRSNSPLVTSSIQRNLSSSSLGTQDSVNSSKANNSIVNTANENASKIWCKSTNSKSLEGQNPSFLAHQSPFFPQEFPTLNGAEEESEGSQKSNTDIGNTSNSVSHGPGPSLRPLTEGNWSRGTANHLEDPTNGHPSALLHDPEYFPGRAGAYPQLGNLMNCPITNSRMNVPVPNILPNASLPLSPQFRQMMHPYGSQFLYNRNPAFPLDHLGNIASSSCIYPNDSRFRQQEDGSSSSFSRPAAPIITDKDLKGFDEILENESHDEWATADAEIDYNAKLVFSDEEDVEETSDNTFFDKEDKEQNQNHENIGSNSNIGKPDLKNEDKDYKEKYDYDNANEIRLDEKESKSLDINEKPKYRPPPIQSAQRQPPQYDKNIPVSNNYTKNKSDISDEDELWKQRSRQHSDEMSAAVARARQRREEEEKKFQQSRLAALEKARLLGEKEPSSKSSSPKDSMEKEEVENLKILSKEEKKDELIKKEHRNPPIIIPPPPSQQPSSTSGSHSGNFVNKQFAKEIPPRFQKKQLQQNQQQNQYQKQTFNSNQYPHNNNRYENSSNSRAPVDHSQHGQNELKNYPNYHQSKNNDHRRSDNQSESDNVSESDRSWRERPKPVNENWRNTVKEKSVEKDDFKKENNDNQVKVLRNNSESDNISRSSSSSKLDDKFKKNQNEQEYIQNYNQTHFHGNNSFTDSSQTHKLCESLSKIEITSKQTFNVPQNEKIVANNSFIQTLTNTSYNEQNFSQNIPSAEKPVEEIKKEMISSEKTYEVKSENMWNVAKDWNQIESEFEKNEIYEQVKNEENTETSLVNEINNTSETMKITVIKEEKVLAESEASQESKGDKNYRNDDRINNQNIHKYKHPDNRYYDDFSKTRNNNYRGMSREYRRTRGSGDGERYERHSHDKFGKFRKDSYNSSESLLSDEGKRKDNVNKNRASPFESMKSISSNDNQSNSTRNIEHSLSPSSVQNAVEDQKLKNLNLSNSDASALRKVIGPSNYGPPPTKAAFGDSRNTVSTTNNEGKKNLSEINLENKTNSMQNSSRQESTGQNIHNRNNINRPITFDSSRGGRDHVYHNRVVSENSRNERYVPPRFQNRNNSRGGKMDNPVHIENKNYRGNNQKNRMSRNRTFSNQESDVGNDEWETASEASDILNKNDRRNYDRNMKFESRGGYIGGRSSGTSGNFGNNRRTDSRKDPPRSQSNNESNYPPNRDNKGRYQGRQPNERDYKNSTQLASSSASGKNENITILALNEMKLDDPKAVGEVINSYQKSTSLSTKPENLNLNESDDVFQKMRKKKKESNPRNVKLPPRLAKQKEANQKYSSDILSGNELQDIDEDKSQKNTNDNKLNSNTSSSWNTYLSHTMQGTTATLTTTVSNTSAVQLQTKNIQQTLSVSSKSSSFDQQDSGIDVSDQQNSAASSQRSSPSNDDKTNTTSATTSSVTTVSTTTCSNLKNTNTATPIENVEMSKPMNTVIFENTNLKAENAVLAKFGPKKGKEKSEINLGNPNISSIGDSGAKTNDLNDDSKRMEANLVNKAVGASRCDNSNKTISPSADDLNIKIASTKKVWDCSSMPALLETPTEIDSNESIKCDEKVKHMPMEPMQNTGILYPGNTSSPQNWPNQRLQPINQEMKMKNYPSNPILTNQMQQMIMAAASGSPEIQNQITEGLRHMQNFHMQNLPPISSPPNLIYNAPAQMASAASAQNMYQSFPQIKNFPHMIPQYATATGQTSANMAAYHQHMMQQQGNAISQQNIYIPTHPQTQSNTMPTDRYRVTPQQNIAAQIIKSQYVPTPGVQNLHRISVPSSSGYFQSTNQPPAHTQQQPQQQSQQPTYYQQTNINAAASLQQQQHQYAYNAAQQQVLSSQAQVSNQAAYRAVQMSGVRPNTDSSLRPTNGKFSGYR